MWHSAASDLGLHSLPMPHWWEARLKRVNVDNTDLYVILQDSEAAQVGHGVESREREEKEMGNRKSWRARGTNRLTRCLTVYLCFRYKPWNRYFNLKVKIKIISCLDRIKRIWYLSPMRAAKVQASLRIRAISPEPSLLAHTSSESRGTFRQKARSLAQLNGWACAVEICHDGMLEDTNLLDAAHFLSYEFTLMHTVFVTIYCCKRFLFAKSCEPRQANLCLRGARDLAFCLKVPLDSLLVWASSGGSSETARMRRLAWTFAARIGESTIYAGRGPCNEFQHKNWTSMHRKTYKVT